jgi:hypothetical protein
MIKAKDFLHFLCEEHDYRFFSGVPDNSFKPIYSAMSGDFMHYIPAVNIDISVGIAVGTLIGGLKSVVLTDNNNFKRFRRDLIYATPILFLLPSKESETGFISCDITEFKKLGNILDKSYKEYKPVILNVGGLI